MFYNIISYLKPTIIRFILLTFIMPMSIYAMEQSSEESFFDSVPQEIKQHMVLFGIYACKNLKEVASLVNTLKLISWEWNTNVEDPLIVHDVVQDLHKRFEIEILDAHYIFHTKAAQKKLQTKMELITKYAFLHHNNLLRQNGGIKSLPVGTSLTYIALTLAYKNLHPQKKENPNLYNTLEDTYTITTKANLIDVIVDAYGADKTGGHVASARLLYLSENTNTALSAIQLKNYLRHKNLISCLASRAFNVFHPDPIGISPIGEMMEKRINPIS